jgi:hypothetical protein
VRPRWRTALLGLLAIAALSPGRARCVDPPAPPLPWQESAPVARLFLQLPFEAPETVEAGRLEAALRLLYSNTLLLEEVRPPLALAADVETSHIAALLRYGLAAGVELQLAASLVADGGGFLDRPIEVVESWFRSGNPQRVYRPRDTARYRLLWPDGKGFSRDGAEAGPGDPWLGVKWHVAAGGGGAPAVAVRAAAKLPAGRMPFGSGELDLGGSVILGWTAGAVAVRAQVDAVAPTGVLRATALATRPYGAASAGLGWRAGGRTTLHAQASLHLAPLRGAGLDQLRGPTTYLVAGATFDLSPDLAVDAGAAENVFSPRRGADAVALLGLRLRR